MSKQHSQSDFGQQPIEMDGADPSPRMGSSGEFCGVFSDFDLTDLQFRAVELMVQGVRDTQIAKILSVDRKTLWTWKTKDPEFIAALEAARRELFCNLGDRYRTILLSATNVLANFLSDEDDKNNRFRAAHVLLTMAGCFKLPVSALPPPPEEDHWPIPDLPPKVG